MAKKRLYYSKMEENAPHQDGENKKPRYSNQRRGLGAHEGSDRREFRKFRGQPNLGHAPGRGGRGGVRGRGGGPNHSSTAHSEVLIDSSKNGIQQQLENAVPNGTIGAEGAPLTTRGRGRGRGRGVPRPRPPRAQTQNNGESVQKVEGAEKQENGEEKEEKKTKKKRVRVCHYINTPGGCTMGSECKFRHPINKIDKDIVMEEGGFTGGSILVSGPSTTTNGPARRNAPFIPKAITLSIDAKGSDQAITVRRSEIAYYKRRFRGCKTADVPDGSGTKIDFKYEVSDPEWAFAVRAVSFSLFLPTDFPLEMARISVEKGENAEMPDILCAHVQAETQRVVQEKFSAMEKADSFESTSKLLIRWIDRNLFDLFVSGLRKTKLVFDAEKAGISLVLPGKTKDENKDDSKKKDLKEGLTESLEKTTIEDTVQEGEEEGESGESEDEDEEEDSEDDDDAHISEESVEDGEAADSKKNVETKGKEETENREGKPPIEITMVWSDSSRNIASLSPILLNISAKCARCKEDVDKEIPANDKPVSWRCAKCSTAQSLRIRPELVHENSPIIGRLDARGCRPIDCILLNCRMKFVCLACNKEDDVQKISYGISHNSWCRSCHQSCEFTISSIRFRGDFSRVEQEDSEAAKSIPKPKKKVEKGVGISDGQALPDYGTCKHYKKSFRWFRFPCCGKVFPCDNCHNEKETGHEMKLANRMICGYCSKEQPFSKDKPCINCDASVTRVRTRFWEGGKGCRDQKMMNKNDSRKFGNSRKKTVSKKKVGQLVVKKKEEKK